MGKADIGVFGGSGFYELLKDVQEVWVETPFGHPSEKIALAQVGDHRVAFLPRHGKDHRFPPHKINYRANLWAMKELGVKRIIGPTASGSLKREMKPGDFVVVDQFLNMTSGRLDTFYDGPVTTHLGAADPYCPQLRQSAVTTARDLGIPVHDGGTVVVINGPRFSTRAESRYFSQIGGEVINMTQYPEGWLARELGICYTNIALITDYDVGLEGEDLEPVSHGSVMKVFQENNEKVKKLILEMIKSLPSQVSCSCSGHIKES